jgi:hypothetical protein
VTNPDLANVLRNMKVPERLTANQALRAYLLAQTEADTICLLTSNNKQVNWLMVLSHLEIVPPSGRWKSAWGRPSTEGRRWF